ncbi:autoinducer 2 ABC transporter substrate-binding protein [Candidatus Pristimantibacillus sp. PTI5]|uniref:autoinducer 2 ABC transporter substrate-binding protein n=1 Tax=Candidatus Pristimantibacillus sp. PTI5 TaxID=3400422 RepID=UPI003B0254A0
MRYLRAMLISVLFFMSACQTQSLSGDYRVIHSLEAGVIGGDVQEQRKYTIGVVPKVMEILYFNVAQDGALEAARDLNVKVIYEGPPITDVTKQIQVIRSLMDRGVDALAISANDPEKLLPVLKEAKQRGIKVITWDADTEPEGRHFFVNMVDPETLGRHLQDTLAWHMGEQGDYAIMTSTLSASNQNEWLKWMNKQREEYYPAMNLVDIVETDDDPHKAYEAAKQLLIDYPNLRGIIGNASVAPPAAAQAVKEAGQSRQIKIVGLSTPHLMHDFLIDGSAQMATLWSPKKLGYLTVVLAYQLLEGEFPHDGQDIVNVGNIRVKGDVVIMGEPLDFTAENVGQYDF